MPARLADIPPSDDQAMAMEVLATRPTGMTCAELAALLGTKPGLMADRLNRMRRRGMVSVVGRSIYSAWCLPQHLEATVKRMDSEAAERRRVYLEQKAAHQRAVAARMAARRRAQQAPIDIADLPDDPLLNTRQAIVPAATAPRVVTRAVASVFDLGYST